MEFEGYEWDDAKAERNAETHFVTFTEAAEAIEDAILSESINEGRRSKGGELRYTAYGVTFNGRPLVVIFTVRGRNLRIISARRR